MKHRSPDLQTKKGPLARALVDFMKQRSDRLTPSRRDPRASVLDGLDAVVNLCAEESGDILGTAHADFAALAPIVHGQLIGFRQRLRGGKLVDGCQRGCRVVVGRVDELAVDIGNTGHGIDDRAFDHARHLVGAVMHGSGALLCGRRAALDEFARGFRNFELALKTAERLDHRSIGGGCGSSRRPEPTGFCGYSASWSSDFSILLGSYGPPRPSWPEAWLLMAWVMVHCNINACDAQNREAREKMLAISIIYTAATAMHLVSPIVAHGSFCAAADGPISVLRSNR